MTSRISVATTRTAHSARPLFRRDVKGVGLVRRALAIGSCLFVWACGAEFEPQSKVSSLRILGVQKSAPYAKPGETVELRMLHFDGADAAPRPLQIAWFGGCFNPPGDLYSGCIANASELGPDDFKVGVGTRFEVTLPQTIIDSRPPPLDPKLPRYGLSYVFFAACAGRLDAAPLGERQNFPLACYGEDDKLLGPDDFVAGFSAIYAYDKFRNENPIIDGFSFDGLSGTPSCVGDACRTTPQKEPDCSTNLCIDACKDDGDKGCRGYTLKPMIDKASAETDEVSKVAYGRDFEEQMWVRYYAERGSVDTHVKLLNDAEKGWNAKHETTFRAPKEPGLVSVWAVVHDNRGGVNWVRQDLLVR